MAENTNPNTIYVIDASALTAIILPDEKVRPKAVELLNLVTSPQNQLIAPHLLKFEFGNRLKSALLRDRVEQKHLKTLYQNFLQIDIKYQSINFLATLKLAAKHQISFYDASYLYLANQHSASLLTLDKQLKSLRL